MNRGIFVEISEMNAGASCLNLSGEEDKNEKILFLKQFIFRK